jgi:CubicO group peptidase (beta-lactamase class C family)
MPRPGAAGGLGQRRGGHPARIVPGCALCAPPFELSDPAALGFDPGRLARIDRHFDRYVQDGRLPGWLAVVARDGQVAHVGASGLRDVEAGLPVEHDTLWRIYSMTKPITSVAAMMLWEEGLFELKSPIAQWLPEFAEARVFRGGTALKAVTDPLVEPIRVWHLLTHTAGLTYGFHHAHPWTPCTAARLRVGHARGPGPRRVLRALGGPAARPPARRGVELLRGHGRPRAPVEVVSGCRWTASSPSASSARSG